MSFFFVESASTAAASRASESATARSIALTESYVDSVHTAVTASGVESGNANTSTVPSGSIAGSSIWLKATLIVRLSTCSTSCTRGPIVS